VGRRIEEELMKHFASVNIDGSILENKAEFKPIQIEEKRIVEICKRLNLRQSGGFDNTAREFFKIRRKCY
jgi:hypothetical protein